MKKTTITIYSPENEKELVKEHENFFETSKKEYEIFKKNITSKADNDELLKALKELSKNKLLTVPSLMACALVFDERVNEKNIEKSKELIRKIAKDILKDVEGN